MAEELRVTETVRIPGDAIGVKAVRSGGPGGQNVNKVSTKIELRIDIGRIQGLDDAARGRLEHLIRNQRAADGAWILTSDRTRDQPKNLEDARAKAVAIILKSLEAPRPRTRTRPTRASQVRRVEAKKLAGEKKKGRRGGWD
ncbi:MAG: alternative ribosome rescue aminoacyl-tRNA hydrolase ArfB [Holophagaceae bacterium]